jgi:RND family efflux transporter MFP subunit
MNEGISRQRFGVLLTAAAAIWTAGCGATPGGTVARANTEKPRPVAVEKIQREDLERSLELAAEFRPWQEVDLHAKIAGYLKAIHADVGDHVGKGQLIAELEAPEMMHDLAQAEATQKRAQLDVERARSELRRSEAQHSIRKLSYDRLASVIKARPNLVAQQEIDDAAARLRDAEAQLSSVQAALAVSEEQVRIAAGSKDRLEAMLTYLRIAAPFAGMITRRLADPGAMIQAGTASHMQAMPVVRLSQVDRLRLVLPAPESVVSRIRQGTPVEVRVDSLSRVFQGNISRFSGKLDSATRTMETEVDLANAGNLIKPGMFGYAKLVLERRLDALSLPVEALSGRGADAKVLVVGADKKVEERAVTLGMETPRRLEILSGLRENDLVVVGARANLRPGIVVEPKLRESSAQGAHH